MHTAGALNVNWSNNLQSIFGWPNFFNLAPCVHTSISAMVGPSVARLVPETVNRHALATNVDCKFHKCMHKETTEEWPQAGPHFQWLVLAHREIGRIESHTRTHIYMTTTVWFWGSAH